MIATVATVLFVCTGTAGGNSPAQVVVDYLDALARRDFVTAHGLLTENMTGGLDAWAWTIQQQRIFKQSRVEIFGFDTYEATVSDETAAVPNVLRSRDAMINTEGEPEYEVYQLVKRNGRWLIDRQRLAKKAELEKLFRRRVHRRDVAASAATPDR